MDLDTQNQSQLFPNRPTQIPLPNATAVLVLGIVSIVGSCCYGVIGIICGIIALVLAKKDFKLYNDAPDVYTQASLGNLKGGKICAIIGLCLSVAYLLVIIIYLAIFGSYIFSQFPWHEIR